MPFGISTVMSTPGERLAVDTACSTKCRAFDGTSFELLVSRQLEEVVDSLARPLDLGRDLLQVLRDTGVRELQVLESLGDKECRCLRDSVAQDVDRTETDAIPRREHVHLRKVDLYVDAPDASAALEIGFVVRAEEELVDPPQQGLLQSGDLGRAAGYRGARVGMRLDRRVEVVDDGTEVRRDERVRLAESYARGVVKSDVPLTFSRKVSFGTERRL